MGGDGEDDGVVDAKATPIDSSGIRPPPVKESKLEIHLRQAYFENLYSLPRIYFPYHIQTEIVNSQNEKRKNIAKYENNQL